LRIKREERQLTEALAKQRQLYETLRSRGAWREVAQSILREAARDHRRVTSDGISSANQIILGWGEEDSIDQLKDHPGKSCSDVHDGQSHDDWMDSEEEEERTRLSQLSQDTVNTRSVVQGPVVPMPELRQLMKTEEEHGRYGAGAARRIWEKTVSGIVEPASRTREREDRIRRRLARDLER
jgi:hypothetical protein